MSLVQVKWLRLRTGQWWERRFTVLRSPWNSLLHQSCNNFHSKQVFLYLTSWISGSGKYELINPYHIIFKKLSFQYIGFMFLCLHFSQTWNDTYLQCVDKYAFTAVLSHVGKQNKHWISTVSHCKITAGGITATSGDSTNTCQACMPIYNTCKFVIHGQHLFGCVRVVTRRHQE